MLLMIQNLAKKRNRLLKLVSPSLVAFLLFKITIFSEKEDSDIEDYEKLEEDPNLKDKVRDKLKKSSSSKRSTKNEETVTKPSVVNVSDSDSDEFQNELEKERHLKRKRKA